MKHRRNISLVRLGLSCRVRGALRRTHIHDAHDLAHAGERLLGRMPGIGPKALAECRQRLAEHNWRLHP